VGEKYINHNNIDQVVNEYEKFNKFLIRKTKMEDYRFIAAIINGDDYFGKFIYRVLINEKVSTRCDAGLSRFSLDSDHKIYSCSAALGIRDLCIGSLEEGIDIDKQAELFRVLHNKSGCMTCEAKYYCGGECMVNSFYNTGRIDHIDPIMCRLKKTFFRLALEFKAEIMGHKNIYYKLIAGSIEKSKRFILDRELDAILSKHQEYTFTELKHIKDTNENFYNTLKNS